MKNHTVTPSISILIPAYNVEGYIEDCILSIKNQKFQDYEVIIVNDGSTDKTVDKIKELIKDDKRYQLIDNKENHGLLKVRKDAYLKARGKFIIFLDSDDRLVPDALTIMYENINNSGADIVDFAYISCYNGKYFEVPVKENIFVKGLKNLTQQLGGGSINC